MIISGTLLGFVSVAALFLASLVLAYLDWKEKSKGHVAKAKLLSKAALGLFIAAFLGGVVVTLVSGVKPREDGAAAMMQGKRGDVPPDHPPMAGGGMMGGAIGKIDEKELQKLQEKVEKNTADVKSRERLGHLYLQMQDYENVFKMAHEAIQVDPKSLESRVHLGMAMNVMGQPEQGMAQLDRVLQADPKHLEALLFKGMLQLQSQDLEGARETWGRFMKFAKPSDNGYERVRMMLSSLQK